MDLFFGDGAGWFSVPAMLGTCFFLLRLAMMSVGGDGDAGGDLDSGGDAGMHHDADSTSAFKVLSIQTIATFTMGFGWGGLCGYRGAGWDATSSLIFGLAAGAGMVWLLGKLLRIVYGLQSSGTVSIRDALGLEGDAYIAIPGRREGRGRVRLVIGDRQRDYNAVTDEDAIESHARVRITAVNDDNTVTVTKV